MSCVQSLCGHSSPVDSVAFNSEEALVLAGASSGVIKLWNLQEAKGKLILIVGFRCGVFLTLALEV